MKVVIAADSFKGSCSAENVAKAMAAGVREVFPQAETVCLPVADGGEGTTDALLAALGGQRVQGGAGGAGAPPRPAGTAHHRRLWAAAGRHGRH